MGVVRQGVEQEVGYRLLSRSEQLEHAHTDRMPEGLEELCLEVRDVGHRGFHPTRVSSRRARV